VDQAGEEEVVVVALQSCVCFGGNVGSHYCVGSIEVDAEYGKERYDELVGKREPV